jgi:hypothetical protein
MLDIYNNNNRKKVETESFLKMTDRKQMNILVGEGLRLKE